MVVDKIENAHLYSKLNPAIEKCMNYIKETDFSQCEPSRITLGEDVTISFSRYETKAFDEREWEAHDHCIDIQYIASGRENMGYANRAQMNFVRSVLGKDKLVYTGDGARILLAQGYFMILFPDDVHKPNLNTDGVQTVQKVVCKIAVYSNGNK